jgi:hypothetical protein
MSSSVLNGLSRPCSPRVMPDIRCTKCTGLALRLPIAHLSQRPSDRQHRSRPASRASLLEDRCGTTQGSVRFRDHSVANADFSRSGAPLFPRCSRNAAKLLSLIQNKVVPCHPRSTASTWRARPQAVSPSHGSMVERRKKCGRIMLLSLLRSSTAPMHRRAVSDPAPRPER